MAAMCGLLPSELAFLKKLSSPAKIQDFLNSIPFNFEEKGETIMSPRRTIKARKAHCLEGALVAAAALWVSGERPLLLDLRASGKDQDHVVALFRRHEHWGAISKTNHAVLRYREPVYKTIRELALSYFHEYFDNRGLKTLRSFSKPLNLKKLGDSWVTAENDLWHIDRLLNRTPHQEMVPKAHLRQLRKADHIEIEAGKIVEYTH